MFNVTRGKGQDINSIRNTKSVQKFSKAKDRLNFHPIRILQLLYVFCISQLANNAISEFGYKAHSLQTKLLPL
jgi:hypothetical protein